MNRYVRLASALAIAACGSAATPPSPPSQTHTTSAPVPAQSPAAPASAHPALPPHPEDSAEPPPSELRSPPPVPAPATRRVGER